MIKRLGPAEPPAPQFYRVACAQGHVLRGPRTEGYQAIRCPGCGEGLFVLPRCPLPEPPAPPAEKARKRQGPEVDEPIQWVEAPDQAMMPPHDTGIDFYEETVAPELEAPPEPEEPSSTPAQAPPRKRKPPLIAPSRAAEPAASPPSRARSARVAPQLAQARPVAGPGQIYVPEQPSLARRFWRYRHLIMLTGVLLLVTATVGYRSYRTWWENLPSVAEQARAEGLKALETGAFDLAKQQLAIAASAFETLRDPAAAEARQHASEAAVFADLANRSLEELVEEVALKPASGTDDSLLTQKNRTILISTRIAAVPREGLGPDLEYRIFSGGKMGRIDLEGFKLLEGISLKVGDPLTFGARLESIHLGSDNLWHVRLAPDSGVFLTSPEAWKASTFIGWPPPEARVQDLP